MRVLLVESDQEMGSYLRLYLGYQEIDVDLAHDSSKALSLIEENEYNTVVGNWLMEPIDALRFFASVRQRSGEKFASLPLLCLVPEEVELEEFMELNRLGVGVLSPYRSFHLIAERIRMFARGGVQL